MEVPPWRDWESYEIDYHRRILQWFGHYLKGEPAPAWIDPGVRYLDHQEGEAKPAGPGG